MLLSWPNVKRAKNYKTWWLQKNIIILCKITKHEVTKDDKQRIIFTKEKSNCWLFNKKKI